MFGEGERMGGDGAFLAAIRADFSADAVRLVYADWLEEHGWPGDAFLRVECELAGVNVASEQWGVVFDRLWAASRGLDRSWVAAVSRVPVAQLRWRRPGRCWRRRGGTSAGLPPVRGYVWRLAEGRPFSATCLRD